jgi:hypothetical protein
LPCWAISTEPVKRDCLARLLSISSIPEINSGEIAVAVRVGGRLVAVGVAAGKGVFSGMGVAAGTVAPQATAVNITNMATLTRMICLRFDMFSPPINALI